MCDITINIAGIKSLILPHNIGCVYLFPHHCSRELYFHEGSANRKCWTKPRFTQGSHWSSMMAAVLRVCPLVDIDFLPVQLLLVKLSVFFVIVSSNLYHWCHKIFCNLWTNEREEMFQQFIILYFELINSIWSYACIYKYYKDLIFAPNSTSGNV